MFAYVPSLQLAIAVAMNYEGSDRMPYARRLYQLLLDEGYNQALYAPARRDQHLADVMEAVFDAGVPHHDRRVRALREDTAALDAAFAYVNELLAPAAPDADAATARDKIEAGRHPVSGSPLPIAGSYMASVVARANDGLDAVHRNGAPELFAAYIEAYRAGTSVRHAHRFAAPVESELLALCDAWRRTWTNDTRQMTWPTYGDLDAIQPLMSKLERRFEAVRVYPDYSSELSRFVTQRVIQEDADAAVHAAEWTLALYPWSASARIDAALARAAAGDVDRASEYASAALAASPDGLASASRLNQRAYGLRSAGGLQAGLALLDLARRLHPDAANLYDSTGDFHLAAGRRDEAISWYEKALEVDPEFENARRVLDRLRAESAAITGR